MLFGRKMMRKNMSKEKTAKVLTINTLAVEAEREGFDFLTFRFITHWFSVVLNM